MNMAIDEAIMTAHAEGLVPPTLRLYGFRPAAVSIGLSQKLAPEAVRRIHDAGFDTVRRPTGGRAVLHLDDLTYSFCAADVSASSRSLHGFLSESVTESYKQICMGLIEAFAQLGIESALGASGTQYRHLQDCFKATTSCDLHHNGVKLIGSAQVRRRGVVLQHGSVPLRQNKTIMPNLLAEPADGARHVNLDELVKSASSLSTDNLTAAFHSGFARAFGIRFDSVCGLTDREKLHARELQIKYATLESFVPV